MNLLANLFNQSLYIDPAATSILLSSITAIVVAIGATAIVLWRKLKKKVSKTLNIDPNAGKEVEEDLVITEDEKVEVKEETATVEEVKEEK
ncbi:MAG: hypothetical protein IJY57_00075 [Clostridia bacterium]|nr:hypothetical protein [Clostridia bacterium]